MSIYSQTHNSPELILQSQNNSSSFTLKNFLDLKDEKKSTTSPLSVIGHIDVNAFFAQVEQLKHGFTRDDPIICVQWQSIIAVSYPARKYGISRLDTLGSAIKKCPHIIPLHTAVFRKGENFWRNVNSCNPNDFPSVATHKVSLDPYRRESRKMLRIFREKCRIVEKASVDESFFNLGGEVFDKAIELFPELKELVDSNDLQRKLPPIPKELPDWLNKAKGVFPKTDEELDLEEENEEVNEDGELEEEESEEESGKEKEKEKEVKKEDNEEVKTEEEKDKDKKEEEVDEKTKPEKIEDDSQLLLISDWDDILMLLGSIITLEVRKEVDDILGYTTSCGIGRVKTIAKLAAGFMKPDNQTIVRNNSINDFLQNFTISDIWGFGGKTGEMVKNSLNVPQEKSKVISFIRDSFTLEQIKKKIDNNDEELPLKVYQVVRGELVTPFTKKKEPSMCSSKRFRDKTVKTKNDCAGWIRVFAGELYQRIKEINEEDYDNQSTKLRLPRLLSFHYNTFYSTISRSKQMALPMGKIEELEDIIFEHGMKLLDDALNQAKLERYDIFPLFIMSLTAGKFEEINEFGFIESFFGNKKKKEIKKDSKFEETRTENDDSNKNNYTYDSRKSKNDYKKDIFKMLKNKSSDTKSIIFDDDLEIKESKDFEIKVTEESNDVEESKNVEEFMDKAIKELDKEPITNAEKQVEINEPIIISDDEEAPINNKDYYCEECKKTINSSNNPNYINEHEDYHFAINYSTKLNGEEITKNFIKNKKFDIVESVESTESTGSTESIEPSTSIKKSPKKKIKRQKLEKGQSTLFFS